MPIQGLLVILNVKISVFFFCNGTFRNTEVVYLKQNGEIIRCKYSRDLPIRKLDEQFYIGKIQVAEVLKNREEISHFFYLFL